MTLFFAAVAILTLALGGIGVMNIMLVAVTERTREIGIRKALGATAVDIRRQFLAESAIITLVSGTLGLSGGIGLCLLLRFAPRPDSSPYPPSRLLLSLPRSSLSASLPSPPEHIPPCAPPVSPRSSVSM